MALTANQLSSLVAEGKIAALLTDVWHLLKVLYRSLGMLVHGASIVAWR